MNKHQLKELVENVLKGIDLYTPEATNLVLGTIAQESAGAEYIKQVKGPALGICQMEPNTFKDIVNNYLMYHKDLARKILHISGSSSLVSKNLEYNLALSIAMCRVHYRRRKDPLPNTLPGYAAYWKKHYNTYLGKGTEEEFIINYKRYV